MLKIIIAVVVLIGALLIFAATKPNTFQVARMTSIKATPERIFPLINDFKSWQTWSPYERLDPGMKKTYSSSTSGNGAVYEWEGNGKVGQGRMEIANISPPTKITINLDFIKPFAAHDIAEFTLEPQGDTTNVTWSINGPNAYISKLMSVFFNMDTMIGKDFEIGLANLKAAVEK